MGLRFAGLGLIVTSAWFRLGIGGFCVGYGCFFGLLGCTGGLRLLDLIVCCCFVFNAALVACNFVVWLLLVLVGFVVL